MLDADVVIVPENDQGQMTGEALRSTLINSHDVFAVVASAGTTNAGIIDDLAGIANVCQRFGVWLHVDGAYGGAALAAPCCTDSPSSRAPHIHSMRGISTRSTGRSGIRGITGCT